MRATINVTKQVDVCDLCRQRLDEDAIESYPDRVTPGRPLKLKWWHFSKWLEPRYDVHESCVYELIKRYLDVEEKAN